MLSISSLLSPLILGIGVLMGVIILDTRTIYIRGFDVPSSVSQAGYSGRVFERKMVDEIRLIERVARTRPETRRLSIDSEKSSLDLIAEYVGIEPLVRAIQGSSTLLEYAVAGEIVADGDNLVLSMRVTHFGGDLTEVRISKPKGEIDELVSEAAQRLVRAVDPQILCAALLRTGFSATPIDVGPAEQCIIEAMRTATYKDRPWLWTLAGVTHFVKRDHAAAARYFVQALKLDPVFSPALLNIGILYALDGRHDEAIKAYTLVFAQPSPEDSPQTYAAAYVAWGDSLLALGRPGDAQGRYAQAIKADPYFLLGYERMLEMAPPGRGADALRDKAASVARQADQLYTENILGFVREAAKPRP